MALITQKDFSSFKPGSTLRLTLPDGHVVDILLEKAGPQAISFQPAPKGKWEYPSQRWMFFYEELAKIEEVTRSSKESEISPLLFMKKISKVEEGAPLYFHMKDDTVLVLAYNGVNELGCSVKPIPFRSDGHPGGTLAWESIHAVYLEGEHLNALEPVYKKIAAKLEELQPVSEETVVRLELASGRSLDVVYTHHGLGGMAFEPCKHESFPRGFLGWEQIRGISRSQSDDM